MSFFTKVRDSVTGAAKDVAGIGSGLLGGSLGALTGGLTGPLSGFAGATGLMELLGGAGGGFGGGFGGGVGGGGSFQIPNSTTPSITSSNPTSLMDMLGQQYQTGPINQTGSLNLTNSGLT